MNVIERAHIDFIKELLRQGLKRDAIRESFVKKWSDLSTRTFDRRLAKAAHEIADEQKQISSQSVTFAAQEAERQGLMLVSVEQRKDILSKIALGQLMVKKPVWIPSQYKGKDENNQPIWTEAGFKSVPCEPSHKDIKSAIAELNKMCNDYPTNKLDDENAKVNAGSGTTIIQEIIIGVQTNVNGNGHSNGSSNGTGTEEGH